MVWGRGGRSGEGLVGGMREKGEKDGAGWKGKPMGREEAGKGKRKEGKIPREGHESVRDEGCE